MTAFDKPNKEASTKMTVASYSLCKMRSPRALLSPLLATALFAAQASALELGVPLFISASDSTKQGFVRIINHSDVGGKIRVTAIDDSGREFDPISVDLEPRRTLHFNSDDLEMGNASKGIASGTGAGEGDWRLEIYIDDDDDLDVEALAYVRTTDGFLTSMHDLTPGKTRHRVPDLQSCQQHQPSESAAPDQSQKDQHGCDDRGP